MSRRSEKEKRKRIKNRRKEYEFTTETKNKARKRSGGYCEKCKSAKATDFHHVTSINTAIRRGLDPNSISLIENCQHVCRSCHHELDYNN